MESKVVKSDFKKLNQLLDGLAHASEYVVRVGIMGQKNNRPDGNGQTNADIGFIHEYGQPTASPPIPQRSFLRMPLRAKSSTIVKDMERIQKVKKSTNIVEILTDFGIECERMILDAFDSAGFGTWPKNAPSTIARKGSSQPLIDLGFLRKSITSEVVRK